MFQIVKQSFMAMKSNCIVTLIIY